MSSADFHTAPAPDYLMAELGIDINNLDPRFQLPQQPPVIGMEFGGHKKNSGNKYAEDPKGGDRNFMEGNAGRGSGAKISEEYDDDMPMDLNIVSGVQSRTKKESKKEIPETDTAKGRKKQSKRARLKGNKKAQQPGPKIEQSTQIGLNEEAQWAYKGTRVQKSQQQQQQDSFDAEAKGAQNTSEQQAIRQRLQEKLKKYENGGNKPASKDAAKALASKLQQIKKEKKVESFMESSQQNLIGENNQKKIQQAIVEKPQTAEREQQSEDPWQRVNQQTLAKKQQQQQAIKNAQTLDLNAYYQNLALPDLEEQQLESEQKPSLLYTILCCLKPAKKKIQEVQKQLLKISKIQLTNKPEETQLLREIWGQLTNKKYLRYGEHWNEVGFQGRDPATDLRSTGVLSLLQWRNFIVNNTQYAIECINFCREFDVPLALTHIKITSLVCGCLKARQLEGKRWSDYQEWYNSFVYYTMEHIRENAKDLGQIGELVQKAVERTKKNIQSARQHYNKARKSKK